MIENLSGTQLKRLLLAFCESASSRARPLPVSDAEASALLASGAYLPVGQIKEMPAADLRALLLNHARSGAVPGQIKNGG